MYKMIHSIPPRQLLLQQTPSLVFSLLIAEVFFKFHSFTLECIAFLGTWYLIEALIIRGGNLLLGSSRRRK